ILMASTSNSRVGVKERERNFRRRRAKEFWLGGLDSNQDEQSQSLPCYQLHHLPADGRQQKRPRARPLSTLTARANFVNGLEEQARGVFRGRRIRDRASGFFGGRSWRARRGKRRRRAPGASRVCGGSTGRACRGRRCRARPRSAAARKRRGRRKFPPTNAPTQGQGSPTGGRA